VGVLKVRLRAFAKANYALEVRGPRADGYHEISSVVQSISLADEVETERSQRTFELRIEPEGTEIGPPEQNTVYRAWRLLCGLADAELPARIRLHKNIPAEAGLGGGSADAAAILCGLNELFSLGLNREELREAGSRIGADVPFALTGGTSLAEGVGEILTPLPAPPAHHLLVVRPGRGADTGAIYRAYDGCSGGGTTSVKPVVAALRSGNLAAFAGAVGNDLERVTARFVPEVETCREELLRLGALGAAMSGSGTAVYGIFSTEEDAEIAKGEVDVPFVGVYEPVPRGMEIL
jgi:4-diphosphocytidyl-2-C-methyl-D-erythritol kinase